jgi:hypothetical protein
VLNRLVRVIRVTRGYRGVIRVIRVIRVTRGYRGGSKDSYAVKMILLSLAVALTQDMAHST